MTVIHPKPNDDGKPVVIKSPSVATDNASWKGFGASATVTPRGEVPREFEGVSFAYWESAPTTAEGWTSLDYTGSTFEEPPLHSSIDAVGTLIIEPDGRVWAYSPTNQFGGYESTYPKGRLTPPLSAHATAIKYAYEKTGLLVKLVGYAGDFQRTGSLTRFYWAKRIGGTPADMGWQSQAVHLLSPFDTESMVAHAVDKRLNELVSEREHLRRHSHMTTVISTLKELSKLGFGRLRMLPYATRWLWGVTPPAAPSDSRT
jgi:hypothetical protein